MNNRDLNNCIYRNAAMGITALKQIIPSVKDNSMKNILVKQYDGYKKQTEITAAQMRSNHMSPTAPPVMSKLMARASIAMKLKQNNSCENVARMLIKGTNTGIMDLTAKLNHTKTNSPETVQLAKDYLKNEQKYIESLKPYL